MPTIGVAVAVPEPWAAQLQQYRTELGDDTATRIPTHVTLVPPLEVEEGSLEGVYEHLDAVSSVTAPFRMHLRGTGTFRPVSPVVFVSVVEGISGCEVLAEQVRSGPLAAELGFPYHPHVTIAHHLDEETMDRAFAELADFDCVFDVASFDLYVHTYDHGWRPWRSFTLAGRP